MSNRRRIARSQTYADRLQRQRRSPPPRRPAPQARLTAGALAAIVAVTAEAGHLASAYVEWPASAARGGYHVLAGAALGLVVALVLTGPLAGGWLAAGAALALAGPVWWLGGAALGAAPYHEVPVTLAAATALTELLLAGVLVATWRRAAPRPRLS